MKIQYSFYTKLNARIIDTLISGAAFILAYQLRFEWHIPGDSAYQMWLLLPAIMVGQLLLSSALGSYNHIWRYISLIDSIAVARGYVGFALILLLLRLALPSRMAILRVPISVITITFLISLSGALVARALRRVLFETLEARNQLTSHVERVLLIGAGRAGVLVSKELASRVDIRPVGFLDDDPRKIGAVIGGLRVLGTLDSLSALVRKHVVGQVIICIPRLQRATLKRLWALCDTVSVPLKIVPTLEEVVHGKVNIATFRAVEMNDLLGREAAEVDYRNPEFEATYAGKRILITGAGGSIGSELALQLRKLNPEALILLDKDENGLHDICVHLHAENGGTLDLPVVADLRFAERLDAIFSHFRPHIVFHAAAHKHVDLMEMNPCEAILNNVIGTHNLLQQCQNVKVSRFVLISTDKAVKPSSIMGASKRVCELMVQEYGKRNNSETLYACVRFGNVLGSRGSVVPLFQKQIARGGPITITHPEVQRFLMTIPEAVCLVLKAGTLRASGEVFVLDMGDPVPMMDLARDMVELSGLRPGKDIQFEISNLRPGEKVREELIDSNTETLSPTRFEKIFVVRGRPFDQSAFAAKLTALEEAARRGTAEDIYHNLEDLEIGFCSMQRRRAGAEEVGWAESSEGPTLFDKRQG